ncbi:MAG: flagellar biosynthetic protein FliO [Deltaproteobacteria bacterium]|nr:flagellar biosynthetic protein FliO [Deltaproteobacteria bacterium]
MFNHNRARALLAGFALNLLTTIGSAKDQVPTQDSATSGTEPLTLGTIDGEEDGSLSTINIRLNHEPTWSKLGPVQDHGSFLQLILPGTLVPEPGKFFDTETKVIPKVAAVQLTPSDAGLRFFVEKDAATVKQALETETLGNRIVLTIDHNKLQEANANALASFPDKRKIDVVGPPQLSETTAEQVIASTQVTHDEPAPSERLKAEIKERQAVGHSGFDFQSKLTQVSAFSAVMFALLIAVKMMRPFRRRRKSGADEFLDDGPVTIKTLASLNLAARQKVSLLQVGGEKILIGVTPENVSFLTTIGTSSTNNHRAPVQKPVPPPMIQATKDFATQLSESSDAIPMKLAPAPAKKPVAETKLSTPNPGVPAVGSRVNIAISEEGIQTVAAPKARAATNKPSVKPTASSSSPSAPQEAIDDVTRMIREKLKTLRSI